MPKVLIIGARGNLGSQLVRVFEKGNEVIGWDREEIDIIDKELIHKKILDIKPAIIVNAAAYNAVDKCEESEEEYDKAKKVNIDGPRNLSEGALEAGALLIHYSSDYVFAGDKKEGYLESYDVQSEQPVNRYGKTKKHGEKAIIELSGKGLKWYLIRTSKLFGPKGESEAAKPSFFDIMLKLAKEKDELRVVDEEISKFTYTPDLAAATRRLVDEDYGYGIYHITNEEEATWYEGVVGLQEIASQKIRESGLENNERLSGIVKTKITPITSADYPRPAKRPKYSALLNTKFPKLRSYKDALREYLETCST